MEGKYIKCNMNDFGCVYRNTTAEWIEEFLKKGIVKPTEGYQFISLSLLPDSGGAGHGGVRVVFDGKMLSDQGAEFVDYDRCGLEVASHIVGLDEHQLAQMSEREKDLFLYDLDLERYECEEEVVIPQITYQDGLVEKVCFPFEKSLSELKGELDNKQIPYAVGLEKCNGIKC